MVAAPLVCVAAPPPRTMNKTMMTAKAARISAITDSMLWSPVMT
jgi:hypothetical protein